MCSVTANVASTTGTAPRSHGDGRALERDVGHVGREDQQAEDEEQAELGQPGHAVVERDDGPPRGRLGRADDQPGQVDGEEPRAVDGVGGAERHGGGGERGDRVQAG
jgi:hypothetical protein